MKRKLSSDLQRYHLILSEIDSAYHDAAQKFGFSDSEMMIFYTVYDKGGECMLRDIVKLSGISKQPIGSASRNMEKNGTIRLESTEGKKKKVIFTEQGNVIAKNTVDKIINIENEIFHSWTKEEREFYLNLSQRYLNAFQEKIKNL